ncbi:3-oxoacyl-[acyl-carrier-protein] synthase III C-terminal domain-containing protein [Chamaesiphon minutus]|uniref:3-oxoacyl-(Acyl-carrier-protein) synthase III n=1 Tax=Chamaesiphon minutus (strain ATCC 27169 / PCC 6605) TaxID=1173020 RepID=K9UEX3_CHAP6|nr:3-oxoacyl-[acyl-carrier-protein] synthase III C-terminal domain-containing protein [Chamaesiphon minutus]AFY93672.1 3-oxoacyl-(acyl-carrier-protein) synthase III [Chamaesiphon minutus PCC 6605]
MQPVSIRSLAINFPQTIRTNDYWLEKFPDLFAQTRQREVRHTPATDLIPTPSGIDLWLQEVTPFLADPFRGSIQRRVLAGDESSLLLECQAARSALTAANLTTADVDLAIVSSLFPSDVGPGLATHLAQQLGLRCPAWNLESTCASALIALQTAQAFIQTGTYRQILIVVSHIGSQAVNDADTLSWSMGDGAAAMVVGAERANRGILSTQIVPTIETCGAYTHELTIDAHGNPRIQTGTGENVSSLAVTAADTVRECCQSAVAAAGISLDRIDYFAFNTPTAWYASVCAKALGIDPERVIDLYPTYANIGPVFPLANLYHAAASGKIRPDDLVLVYANGAGATAAAMVIRWGDVALGTSNTEVVPIRSTNAKRATKAIESFVAPVSNPVAITEIGIKERLLAVPAGDRHAILEPYLVESLANLRQVSPADLDPQVVLTTLLDSLVATIFRSQLEASLGIRVPMEQFVGERNIRDLTEFLLDRMAMAETISGVVRDEGDVDRSGREVFSL